jgi:hypothetical protein
VTAPSVYFSCHASRDPRFFTPDKQYEIAKAIAKTARRSEERLSRFESIAHYSKGTRQHARRAPVLFLAASPHV